MKFLLPADLTNILLNENAYFYKAKKKITKSDILTLFNDCIRDKGAKRKYQSKIRESLFDGGKEVAKFSLEIFEFKQKPSFLDEPEDEKWETKYGLFLLLEYKDYVAIIRKNVSGTRSLRTLIENIDYKTLAYFLVTQKSKFEKIISSNMNTSENAIQIKQSEAVDLKGTLSRFGASKQILNVIRLDNTGEKHAVALNTSRVNSFKLKSKFEKTLFWIVGKLSMLDGASKNLPKSSFLDGFATPIKFRDEIDNLEPTFVLIRFGTLLQEIEENKIEKCYKIDQVGNEVSVDLEKFITSHERLFELTKTNPTVYECGNLKVRKNANSISVSNDDFNEIIIDYGNENTTTLSQYINYSSNFMVNFDKLDYVYSHGKIFRDTKLLGDLDNFFATFISYPSLNTIKSEKGKKYTTASTKFNANSLFGFIENEFCVNAQCLICDDLGVEWGDFISIENDSISFYHAKSNDGGLSASKLEEVFGQAQKNFGFLELTDDMIDYRSDRWLKNYKLDTVQTKIKRIRKCPQSTDKIQEIKNLSQSVSSSGNFRRKVFIVINFISKSKLEASIKELKSGKKFEKKGVTLQILWFVNSLLCSANELSAELRIICKP